MLRAAAIVRPSGATVTRAGDEPPNPPDPAPRTPRDRRNESVAELARRARCSPPTVYTAVRKGELRPFGPAAAGAAGDAAGEREHAAIKRRQQPLCFEVAEGDRWMEVRAAAAKRLRLRARCATCGGEFERPRSMIVGRRRLHCSIRCYHADPDRRGVRRDLVEQAGACGSPTCQDARCAVDPGRCHRTGCERPAAIAASTRRAQRHVAGLPEKYCSPGCAVLDRNAGVPWAEELAQLHALGYTIDTLRAALELSRAESVVLRTAREHGIGRQIRGSGTVGDGWRFRRDDIDELRRIFAPNDHLSPLVADPRANVDRYVAKSGDRQAYARASKALARAKGKRVGRPSTLSEEELEEIFERRGRGQPIRKIAYLMDLPKGRVERALRPRHEDVSRNLN
jgi:hypothetical protein